MKKMSRLFLVIFTLIAMLSSCGQQKDKRKKEVEAAVDKIDNLKGNFNPSIAINPASSHWAINVTYDGRKFTVDSTYASIRRGRLPYANEQKLTLPFAVKYFDAAGKLLGQYSIENPADLKSCEPDKEGRKTLSSVVFEILIPANEAISIVEISSAGREARRFHTPKVKRNDQLPGTTDTTKKN
jgi:hypothetical protein